MIFPLEQERLLCQNNGLQFTVHFEGASLYPLSPDEHAAVARHLSGIRKQLQHVSDFLTARYGRDSSIAEIAMKTSVSSTLLEYELEKMADGHAPVAEDEGLEEGRPAEAATATPTYGRF